MSREVAFLITLSILVAPNLALGWLRGWAAGKACCAIYLDLKQLGIVLSKQDVQQLLVQLQRKPKSALDTESNAEVRALKQRHLGRLLTITNLSRRFLYVSIALVLIFMVSFEYFWSGK